MKNLQTLSLLFLILFFNLSGTNAQIRQDRVRVSLERKEFSIATGKYSIINKTEEWKPSETAIIICDMWDKHWCNDATNRVNELAPQINTIITIGRNKGMLIVHAPSDCMAYYKDYPQRKLAQQYKSTNGNHLISDAKLPSESNAFWPIDDSDGGCTDVADSGKVNHVEWKKENALIKINAKDAISDNGIEISGLFKARGIKNVILMGVHTNMCIINRSFGLRNMVRLGMNAVLMRDMTDAMYDSRQWPYVSHFKGLGLIVDYIEKYICPTILSTDFTGQKPFQFKNDKLTLVDLVTTHSKNKGGAFLYKQLLN